MKRKIALVLIAAFCVSSLMPEMQSKASEINGTEIQSQIEAESGEESNEVYEEEQQQDENKLDDAANVEEYEQKDEEKNEEQVPSISYSTHVQRIGWQNPVKDGVLAGTEGRSLRMEGVKINLENVPEEMGGIEYSAHVQRIGWQPYVSNGEMAGTSGRSLRVEAVRIRLTGELANQYHVYYRTHIQSYGWLGWAKDGEKSGSATYGKRMEAIQICLVKDGDPAPGSEDNSYVTRRVLYQAHSQSYGWLPEVYDNADGGMIGKSKRLEALKISLPDQEYDGDIEYRAFVQGVGWQEWKKNGQQIGTVGSSKRIEAMEVRLTGELAEKYSVYYSVHMANVGWSSYAKDGETAGSTDLSKRIEAVRIQIVKNGEAVPDTSGIKYIEGLTADKLTYSGIVQDSGESNEVISGETLGTIGKSKRLESLKISLDNNEDNMPRGEIVYATHLSNVGWQDETTTGIVNGCTDGTHGIEAVKISLSGDIAKYYDIYYRAHIQYYGWLGWAKNGQVAGTTKVGYRLEGLQIKLVSKDASAPGSNSGYYTEQKYRRYQNPSQYYQIKGSISLSGGGYNLSKGYEGIKVRKVIQKLGLGNGIGMGGAYYGDNVVNAVKKFQKSHGLPQTGTVDLITWKAMGFNDLEWESWGAYVSPIRVNENSTRNQHIEAMIRRAYDYLGNDYVIGASGAPGLGIDCSGLVMQALYAAGLDTSPINPVSHAQPGHEYESRNMWASSKFKHVPYSQRQRGDLIFYQSSNGVVIHVAIYLGNNQVIEAWPNKVVVAPIRYGSGSRANIKGIARPFV